MLYKKVKTRLLVEAVADAEKTCRQPMKTSTTSLLPWRNSIRWKPKRSEALMSAEGISYLVKGY